MGFFSWECKACNLSILNPYVVNLWPDGGWLNDCMLLLPDNTVVRGSYDGYGRIEACGLVLEIERDKDGPCLYHARC